MMVIRKEQIDAFLLHDEEAFIDFIIEHLHDESADLIENIPADSLREMVVNGLARARRYGLRSPEDLSAFVSIMFEIAPNFDEQPDIQRVLRDESIPIDKRFDMLFEKVPDEAWEEAEQNCDDDAWFPELQEEEEE